ncbi:MAG: hypothetical protein V3S54_02000 [Woeseiaceae bacterium]
MPHPDRAVSGRDVCEVLEQVVMKYPELRVGQILVVATKTIDHFNIENEELAKKLNVLLWDGP